MTFDPWNVRRDAFVTAPDAWDAYRRGDVDGDGMGFRHIGLVGAWFAAGSLVRDVASLARIELLPCDYWNGIDNLTNNRDRLPEFNEDLDSIAARLAGDGATFTNACRVLEGYDWIGISDSVVSYHALNDMGLDHVTLPAA
ncbi:MAG: hypothetical protein CMM46_01130 [Rhodospirillaceae bacterium]|nr:hypothetical protein [Rhodospirillaceae bacterium]